MLATVSMRAARGVPNKDARLHPMRKHAAMLQARPALKIFLCRFAPFAAQHEDSAYDGA